MGQKNDVPSTLTDDTIMVFGKFKKKRLADVPAWWLLWVEKQSWFQFEPMNDNLAKYIRENRDLLEKQMAENKTKK